MPTELPTRFNWRGIRLSRCLITPFASISHFSQSLLRHRRTFRTSRPAKIILASAEPKIVKRSIARWLLTAGLVAVGSFAPTGDHVRTAVADSEGIENLKKTLEEVLRARRPEEFAFIDVVTDRVANGTLPRSLVESTFNWARKKPHYKFQYFEQGLRVRAKKIGIVL